MIRPFRIDYAGAWVGHDLTRENAINAAGKHLTLDGYTRATITDLRTGLVVAQVRMNDNRKGTQSQLKRNCGGSHDDQLQSRHSRWLGGSAR